MAWAGDTLYAETRNTASERHFFRATPTNAEQLAELPPEAVTALERQEISGGGSACNSARVNGSMVTAENVGHGSFKLFMQTALGEHIYTIAVGNWEIESFIYEPDRSLVLFLDQFMTWTWGDLNGAIVAFDLNTRQSHRTYVPDRPEKLLAALPEGDGYLVAYTTYGPCEPELLPDGTPQARPSDAPRNVCFANVRIGGKH
jgi:hypothetical protein